MTPRSLLILVLALILGASAAVGVNSMRNQEPPPAPPKPETVPVLVAATDIPPFAAITSEMVKVVECQKDLVPTGALTRLADVQNRAALYPIVKEEPLLDAKLGSGRGMESMIPEGMRAFTIHTPTVEAGVAGFILPQDKVDILLTLNSDGNRGGSTVTLLQNVKVLAIEQRVLPPAESKVDLNQLKSVTMLVSQQEAARLTLGQTVGKLWLTLRNHSDKEHTVTQPVHIRDITGEPLPREEAAKPAATKPLAPPPPPMILIQRGTEGSLVRLPSAPPATAASPAAEGR